MRDSGLGADVSEGAVVVVAVKLSGMAFAGAHVLQRGTIDEEDVHPSVIVVIENGDAPAHGFHDVAFFLASAGEVEINSGGASHVGERY